MTCDWCLLADATPPSKAACTIVTGALPARVDVWFLCENHASVLRRGITVHLARWQNWLVIDEYVRGPLPRGADGGVNSCAACGAEASCAAAWGCAEGHSYAARFCAGCITGWNSRLRTGPVTCAAGHPITAVLADGPGHAYYARCRAGSDWEEVRC